MQSHQLNDPRDVVHSLDQEMDLSENPSDLNVKPFSLRQYVHATRERDISLNWPFSERCLKTCLKHGIINVLPPFESHDSTDSTKGQLLRKDVGFSCSQEEKETDVSVRNNVTSITKDLRCSQVEKATDVSAQDNVTSITEDLRCSQVEKATDVLAQDNVTRITKDLRCSQIEKETDVSVWNNVPSNTKDLRCSQVEKATDVSAQDNVTSITEDLSCSQVEKATDVSDQNNLTSIIKDLRCSQVERATDVSARNNVTSISKDLRCSQCENATDVSAQNYVTSITKNLSCSQVEKATDVSAQNNMTSITKDLSCSQGEKGNVVSTQNDVTSEDEMNKASQNLNSDESIAGVPREVYQSLSNSRSNCREGNQCSPDTVLEHMGNQSSTTAPSLHSQDGHSIEALTSPKRFRPKRRKHKGKVKKRSMVDICAVAKSRTLEDLEKSYRLAYDSVASEELFGEENVQMTPDDHVKPDLTMDCSARKCQSDHDAAADEILPSKRKWEVKFKFSRCKSKSRDKKLKLSQVIGIKEPGSSSSNSTA